MIYTALGIVAALLFVFADSIYIRDIFRGTTKPQRMGWGIATLLNAITLANQLASGASDSLWLFGAAFVIVGFIFILSFKFGVGGRSKDDFIALAISLAGIMLWIIFSDPIFSIIGTLMAMSSLMTLNFSKAKVDPHSETLSTWVLATISTFLNTVAVGEWNIDLLMIPFWAGILQGYMSYLIWAHRKNTSAPDQTPTPQ